MSKDKGVKNIKKKPAEKSALKAVSAYQAEKSGKISLAPFENKKK
jgi:hypothetical protein